MMSRAEMTPGGFEFESFRLLRARGHLPERMDGGRVADRFPAWRGDLYPDGFFHAGGGYAESGRVVAWMIEEARRRGVEIREGFRFSRWIERKGRIAGVESDDGQRALCDDLVLAAGAWTGRLHPELRDELRPVAQPVFHLKPRDPDPFRADRFPVFAADIARTGWYGFPANADGIVKVANHGPGREVDPDGPRDPAPEDERALRDFLDESFPALADAPIVERRLCLYSDSRDGHFWIARDPNRPGLTIAAGGSGHGFKFAPVIGDPIADAVEGIANEFTPKFRWRPGLRLQRAEEEARCHGAEYVKRLTD
jgi:glycine/D-amino acid oxidase-like deaminating enzyme